MIIQITVIIHAVVNDYSSHYSTTCTTRTCIEYVACSGEN